MHFQPQSCRAVAAPAGRHVHHPGNFRKRKACLDKVCGAVIQAFLYLDLTAAAAYRKPLPEQVQQELPAVAVLDIDAHTSELVLHYALRLLRESEKAVVYITTDATAANFGTAMSLLEELFQSRENRLILFEGDHPRLLRMFQARPYINFRQIEEIEEEEALEEVKQFLEGEALL